MREKNFLENLEYIEEFNSKNDHMELGINELSDLSKEEFASQYNGQNLLKSLQTFADNENIHDTELSAEAIAKLPETVDLRSHHVQVRSQGHCGSCWSFGCLATIEYAFAELKNITTGHLSTQEMVDCASNQHYLNMACDFGLSDQAYDYVVDNGIYQDRFYPYHASKGICKNETEIIKKHEKIHISGYNIIPQGSNDSVIMEVLANKGPITTAIKIDVDFKHYKTGIVKNVNKGAIFVNHVLALIGYTTINQTDVWIVVNSWGRTWGYEGFGYIERGYNQMGINNYNIYPLL